MGICTITDCFLHSPSVCLLISRQSSNKFHKSSKPISCYAQRLHPVTAILSSLNKALLSVASSRDSRSPSTTGLSLICCSKQLKREQPTLSHWLSCNHVREVQREQALAEKRNPQPPRVVSLLPLSQVCSTLGHLSLWASALKNHTHSPGCWLGSTAVRHVQFAALQALQQLDVEARLCVTGCGHAEAVGPAVWSWGQRGTQSCECGPRHGC